MSGCPHVSQPRDLPGLRDWLIGEWQPGRPFAVLADQHVHQSGRLSFGTIDRETAGVVAWNLRNLGGAELWWVDASMVDLIETAAADLPPTELHEDLLPTSNPVLVVFERPVQGTDAVHAGQPVRVDGMLWGQCTLSGFGEAVSMTLLTRSRFRDWPEERQQLTRQKLVGRGLEPVEDEELWLPIGRTDWIVGTSWEFEPPYVNETEHASKIEDRRWLLTLWSLASEPRVSTTQLRPADRAARRRAQRAKLSVPDVRVVNLRGSVYAAGGASREQTGERTYHVRWPVRGHWRQQPYGPGRRLRRPQFIAPYVKGPEGAPLRKGATVKVLRDDP